MEYDVLVGEDLQYQVVGVVEVGLGIIFVVQFVLIVDDYELIVGVMQFEYCWDYIVDEVQFFVGIDLEIGWFFDQGIVVVDKQNWGYVVVFWVIRVVSMWLFCFGLLMVMCSVLLSWGVVCWLCIIILVVSSVLNVICVLVKCMSRQLFCEGYMCIMLGSMVRLVCRCVCLVLICVMCWLVMVMDFDLRLVNVRFVQGVGIG